MIRKSVKRFSEKIMPKQLAPAYAFQPMTAADLPRIRRWLAEPHVRQWWGEPDEQYALVSGDLDEPAMDQYMVSAGGTPFGYLQCYDLTVWNCGFGVQPKGTRGIDLFIGEGDMIGRGLGSALIRTFVDDRLRNGAPRVVTDPDPANERAIRAYQNAGFTSDRLVETPDGTALLMVRDA